MPLGAFACGSAICRFLFCVSNKALLLLLLFSRCSLLLSCLLRNFYFPECYTSLRSVMFELRRIPFRTKRRREIRFPSALDWISVSTMHDSTNNELHKEGIEESCVSGWAHFLFRNPNEGSDRLFQSVYRRMSLCRRRRLCFFTSWGLAFSSLALLGV